MRIVTAGLICLFRCLNSLAFAANSLSAAGVDAGQSAVYVIGCLAAALIRFSCSLVGFCPLLIVSVVMPIVAPFFRSVCGSCRYDARILSALRVDYK